MLNSVSSSAQIKIDGYFGLIDLIVTDLNRKLVMSQSNSISELFTVDLNELDSRIYYLQINVNDQLTRTKLVKE